jgi:protein tyrosine/serine phosphatase
VIEYIFPILKIWKHRNNLLTFHAENSINYGQEDAYLRKFSPTVELIRIGELDKNEIYTIPSYWKNALSESITQNRVNIIHSEWEKDNYRFFNHRGHGEHRVYFSSVPSVPSVPSVISVVNNHD